MTIGYIALAKSHKPRIIELVRARQPRHNKPSDHTVTDRMQPVLGLVANGHAPAEPHGEEVGRALEHMWESAAGGDHAH